MNEQVTGLLLFIDGKFMQYLEGPKAGVLKVFDLIKIASLPDVDAHVVPRAMADAPLIDRLDGETTDASTLAQTQLADFWKKN